MRLARTVMMAAMAACSTAALGLGEPPDIQKELENAATEVTYMSFDRAFPMYEDAARRAQELSPQWQEAVFGEALCQHQTMPASEHTIGEAKRLFALLVEKCPDSRFTPRAMMNLGRIAELVDYKDDVADRETAKQWYAKAAEKAKGTPLEGEAALRIAATYVQSYEKEQVLKGISILRDYVETHAKDPLASPMWQYMADTYFYPLQDYRNSLDCYKKADLIGLLEEGREGPVYWRIACMAERYLNDRDTAIEYYRKIITKTPTSGKAYESQLALKRLGVEPPKIEVFGMMGTGDHPPATGPAVGEEAAK